MPNYRSPGVHLEEVQAGSRPIERVGTATAAFVGITAAGPYNEPIKVSNWGQNVRVFGEWVDGAYLPHAVYQYFNNQGSAVHIVRIGENARRSGQEQRQARTPVPGRKRWTSCSPMGPATRPNSATTRMRKGLRSRRRPPMPGR